MKKIFITLLLLLLSIKFITAQNLTRVLLDPYYPIDFIGLDFSEVKLIGSISDYEPSYDVKNRFIPEWNDMFYSQPEKYNVADFLKKNRVDYSIENMISVNVKIDETELISNSNKPAKEFTKVKLQEMINNYNFEFTNEVAMVFVINSLNKSRKETKLNVVFFNTDKKNILLSIPLVTEPKGFGFRNYWIGSIYFALKELGKTEYKKWKKLYK